MKPFTAKHSANPKPYTLLAWLLTALMFSAPTWAERALFDAHLHYNHSHMDVVSPTEVIEMLDRTGISHAVFSSRPTENSEILFELAPERIIPFVMPYHDFHDKASWWEDPSVVEHVKNAIDTGVYRGIGELHLFKDNKHAPVYLELIDLAAEHDLILQLHGDAEIIDVARERAPEVPIIWAHLGTDPRPEVIREMLERHPEGLYVDTSVRDQRLVPDGRIDPDWKQLLLDYPDRFMIGVDTFSDNRWVEFPQVVRLIRHWLEQLPDPVAHKIGYQNAADLFNVE